MRIPGGGLTEGGRSPTEVSPLSRRVFPQDLHRGIKQRRSGGRSGRGSALRFFTTEGSQLAWPARHRLPDEVVHEVPSDRCPRRRRCEGRVQPSHRLSDRRRSTLAITEEGCTWS